jgi:hypothetical protein
MLFSIFTADWSGHEVVIDGYQIGPTDKVHINLGWSGAYNGYYDITHSFTAAYEWQADYQVLVTGIAPDNTPPLVAAGGDQVAAMGQAVTLSGTAVDPDGFALGQIRWVQRSGPLVLLTDAASLQTTFTAPQVAAGTDLAFELVVSDPHGAEASDTCTITVYPPLDRPVAMAGSDQTVSGGSEVNLTGSAMASEGHAIQTHAWVPPTDADQRVVRLSSENALSTSFIAPIVTEDTALIFTFQVSDTSGQDAEDRCTVTVRAEAPLQPESVPDAAESPVANDTGGRSSGGGPCFVGSLHP